MARNAAAVAVLTGAGRALAARKNVPVGLELYSVRDEVKADVKNVLRQVAKMGYEVVEHYSLYWDYTPEQAKELRKLMDDLGIRCVSTHNAASYIMPDKIQRAIEMNQILGSSQIIVASAGRLTTANSWMVFSSRLDQAAQTLRPHGLRTGFHNHGEEFRDVEGKLPMDIIATNTAKDVILQIDVGAALSVGADIVAFMKKYPGRIASMHVKDWSSEPGKGFKVLLGEGSANWQQIFEVAETVGGIEYYIVEQEGSNYPPMETVERCLKIMRKLRS